MLVEEKIKATWLGLKMNRKVAVRTSVHVILLQAPSH